MPAARFLRVSAVTDAPRVNGKSGDGDRRIVAVPTNIVTGFLGAGKTSAILNLLKYKPLGERWAVLVNEFGEIGVDGSIVKGSTGPDSGVYVREVPGGCMCCTAGLPMQIALTQLLRKARPHRLLIEPTGLGHPIEVLQTLSADYNREALSIQKTLTLIDARNLSEDRYTKNETFRQQLAIADVVVANKKDLYGPDDQRRLNEFLVEVCRPDIALVHTEYGHLGMEHLSGPTAIEAHGDMSRFDHPIPDEPMMEQEQPIPSGGYIAAVNRGEGFESIGWRFSPDRIFDRNRLFSFLGGLDVTRMKGVFITKHGVFGYNMAGDSLTEVELDDCVESRIEIISDNINPRWADELTGCLSDNA